MKLQRKIYQANLALQYFVLNNWHFKNQNFISLSSDLKLKDMKAFNFYDFLEFDLILYFRYAVLGGRRYLLKEKDKNLPRARRNYRRMKFLDYFVKALIFGSIFYFVFIKHDFLWFASTISRIFGKCEC